MVKSPLAKNGTAIPIMTANQTGKSVFANMVNLPRADDWDVMDNSKAEKPVEYLEFNDDPLALVCAMLRAGKGYYDIEPTLQGSGQTRLTKQIPIDNVIEDRDRERAAKIRRHFRNKILMRRLKNMNISKFMLAVDDLMESPQRIVKENVRPFMKKTKPQKLSLMRITVCQQDK